MQENYCQSCGMPLRNDSEYGTEKDGGKAVDYCTYCYKDGVFAQDCTMDEMIEHCVAYLDEYNKDTDQKFTREEAVAMMKEYFPNLKRWRQ